MKKISLTLLLGLFALLSTAQSYQKFQITFKESNGNLWLANQDIYAMNTDTLVSFGFYDSYITSNPKYRIFDSVLIPASYTGNQITFGFPACGTVTTFDTLLDPNIIIDHVVTFPCNLSCDAEFTYHVNEHGNVGMASTDVNSNHRWYVDNSLVSTSRTHNEQLSGVGPHLVSHVVINTGNSCYDSVSHVASIDSLCDVDFSVNVRGGDSVDFYPVIIPAGRNAVITYGDGNEQTFISGAWSPIHYSYAQTNTYSVKIKVYGQGCADSVVKSINTTEVPCNSDFTMTNTNPFQWNIVRDDSSSGSATWTISGLNYSNTVTGNSFTFNAPGAGYFQIKCDISISGTPACFNTQSLNINQCGTLGNVASYYGQVQFANQTMSNYDSLIVYRIAYDSVNAILTAMDSVILFNQDSGWFNFVDCDNYTKNLFKAALLPGSGIYSSYLPTYADSSVLWSGANQYGPNHIGSIIISMKMGTNTGGPGFIGGYITQGANKNGAGLDGIQVTLFTDAGVPIAFTNSFNAGRYEFSNLAYGKYQVLVEIPGKPSAVHFVNLNATNESVDDLDFEVNSTYISTLNSVRSIKANLFKAYPNPASKSLVIEMISNEVLRDIKVFSIQGVEQTISYKLDTEQKLVLDISSLKSGVYLVQAGNDKVMSILRFIKQ